MTTPARSDDLWQVECTSPAHPTRPDAVWAVLDGFTAREEAERYANDLAARCAAPWERFDVTCRVRRRGDADPVLVLHPERILQQGLHSDRGVSTVRP